MRYFSTFSGIGGFELGIQRAFDNERAHRSQKPEPAESNQDMRQMQLGETISTLPRSSGRIGATDIEDMLCPRSVTAPLCVGYSEIDRYAIKIYERNFNHKAYGDITKIKADELPDFDCLVGGFPCQAFSIAGKRGGFSDTRGTLFFDLARILRAKQPRLFVFENVKGLLNHDRGNTFRTIIATIDELGYDVQWQVLNSKNHGVPQNRERVIIVGHLRGTGRPEVFPITEVSGLHLREITSGVSDAQRIYTPDVAKSQKALGGGLGAKTGLYAVDMTHRAINDHRVRKDGHFGAITASYYKGCGNQERPGVLDNTRIRRLTPVECERLQGFPDNWTAGESDTQRYKMCGNAVTTNVIQAVFERIFASVDN